MRPRVFSAHRYNIYYGELRQRGIKPASFGATRRSLTPSLLFLLRPQMSLGRGARLCLRPHDPTPAHTVASAHPPCPPARLAPRQPHQSGHATPRVLLLFVEVLAAPRSLRVPPATIATNPAVTLLETTVILINEQVHSCILLTVRIFLNRVKRCFFPK